MNIFKIFIVLAVAVVVIFIVTASKKQYKEKEEMISNCLPTDLYVIGDRGHRNRIYNCAGVEL